MHSSAVALESQRLAEELYRLIQTLDPARWRQDLEATARERLIRIREQLNQLLEETAAAADGRSRALREALTSLAKLVDEHVRRPDVDWRTMFSRLQPAYEAIAMRLRSHHIELPVLRQTNNKRSLFHMLSGCVALVFLGLTPMWLVQSIIVTLVIYCWAMEVGRRVSPRLNDALMRFYGPIAHAHEHHRINSATWYTTALTTLAFFTPALAAALGVAVLAFADPAAAFVGRRWGRVRLLQGRSLEGSLTFVLVGALVSVGVVLAGGPAMSVGQVLAVSLGAGVSGAVAELFSGRRVDDNLTIPLIVGFASTAVLAVVGVTFL